MPPPIITTIVFILIHLVTFQLICFDGLAQTPETSTSLKVEEFTHLINRAKVNKRVHLISELVRNGHRLQVEEYLDIERWFQFIQFKWHDNEKTGDSEGLVTQKINVIILNEENRKIIVQYEPYLCEIQDLNTTSQNLDFDWKSLLMSSESMGQEDSVFDSRKHHLATIRSILSTAKNSPYLARIGAGAWSTPMEAWVFGVSGLWIKAQYPGQNNKLPYQKSHDEKDVRFKDADSWRLDLEDSDTSLMYYFDGIELDDDSRTISNFANSERESAHLIEVRGMKETRTIDTINIIDADFNFSNELRDEIFNLPIGFNCQPNPLFSEDNLRFESYQYRSILLELEFVATKYKELKDPALFSATDIKTVSIARSIHPLNSDSSLGMYHIFENKFKTIRDFQSRVRYNMHQTDEGETCEINRLHSIDSEQSYDLVDVVFKNGVSISITEYFLDYLLNPKKHEEKEDEMKLLNRVVISQTENELVFESQVPEWLDYIVQVSDKDGKSLARKISLIRVYRAREVRSPLAISSRFSRQGTLKLDRIILLVFDHKHEELMAEIRINFLKRLEPLSFSRRAKLFDVSQCFSQDETMQLVATYPVDSNLLSIIQDKSHDLVEAFYLSPLIYFTNNLSDSASSLDREKKRLALSLNYFRVPKVELLRTEEGDVELHFTLLDKLSPLYLFDQLEESTFNFEPLILGENLMVGHVEECAKMCQLFRCRMFAFDKESFECKLSLISLDDDNKGDEISHSTHISRVIRRMTSTIYWFSKDSEMLTKQANIEEATLAELLSYLEHYGADLKLDDSDNASDKDDTEERVKRDVSLENWPLFTFHYVGRSQTKTTWGPSQRFSLVPNQVRAVHVPLMLDVSGEAQLVRALGSFKTKILDKAYYMEALIEVSPSGEIWQFGGSGGSEMMKEKTFIDKNNQIYYTLKKLNMVEMDTCALMCFNIDEWDVASRSKQTCTSFSYCGVKMECILLVATDFSFTSTINDVSDEGEQVLNVESTESLSRLSKGCLISMRNYLAGFEGPLKLPPNVYGSESSENLKTELQFEWLTAMRVESSKFDEQAPDNCANKCAGYNKNYSKTCLALDTCTKRTIVSKSESRYEQTCHLFLVNTEQLAKRSSQVISTLASLRNQLTSTDELKMEAAKESKEAQTCNRYLIAHQTEFNHLKQRQVSEKLVSLLTSPSPPIDNINMNDCAFECSMRAQKCLAFEYCSRLEQETRLASRRCSLFGGPRGVVLADKLANDESSNMFTTYNRDCHLYLRKEYHSLEELLVLKSSSDSSQQNLSGQIMRCILFGLFYFVLVLVVLYYMGLLKTPNILKRST